MASNDRPTPPWDYLVEKGHTDDETYRAYEQALADGDTDKASELYDKACGGEKSS